MNYNYKEYGQIIYVNFNADISKATKKTIYLQPRFGREKTFTTNLISGKKNANVDDEIFIEKEFLEYTLQDGDIDYIGQWRVRGSVVVDSKLIKTDYTFFTVLP